MVKYVGFGRGIGRFRRKKNRWRKRTFGYHSAVWEARATYKCAISEKTGNPKLLTFDTDPVREFSQATQHSESSSFSLPLPMQGGISIGGSGNWGVITKVDADRGDTWTDDGVHLTTARVKAWWLRKKGWFVSASWAGISHGGIGGQIGNVEILATAQSKKYTVKCWCNKKTGKPEIKISLGK
jgi:hypothetical protein